MLKTTHRPSAPAPAAAAASSLPTGWTEHRAPSGHLYYYNAETKQSTYTKPVAAAEAEDLVIDYGATLPDREMQASMSAMQEFHKSNKSDQNRLGHFTGGRSYQARDREARPYRQGDRPKSKKFIPNCSPWVLVKTKFGRRFVHNPETQESFWKFPSEVMMAVIDMDRVEWQNKQQQEQHTDEQEPTTATTQHDRASNARNDVGGQAPKDASHEYDSEEYEEVEVTDEEDDVRDPTSKRPKLDSVPAEQPVELPHVGPQEFNEDDIAWQLAQMDADEDDDPGYDFDYEEDEDGGMPLTNEDRDALFRNLLDEFDISPFSTFDALIDTNTSTASAVIMDHRWATLPNMNARRSAFVAWSRDRVAARKAAEAAADDTTPAHGSVMRPGKTEPRVAYLRLLSQEATPKLYWPEFKRKFRKAPEMTDRYFADKDREKLYREYIAKLKTSESDRKKEFTSLLKSVTDDEWKEARPPLTIEKDIRFYGVRDAQAREEMVNAYISTLPKR